MEIKQDNMLDTCMSYEELLLVTDFKLTRKELDLV